VRFAETKGYADLKRFRSSVRCLHSRLKEGDVLHLFLSVIFFAVGIKWTPNGRVLSVHLHVSSDELLWPDRFRWHLVASLILVEVWRFLTMVILCKIVLVDFVHRLWTDFPCSPTDVTVIYKFSVVHAAFWVLRVLFRRMCRIKDRSTASVSTTNNKICRSWKLLYKPSYDNENQRWGYVSRRWFSLPGTRW
jgi:hypothetical protein